MNYCTHHFIMGSEMEIWLDKGSMLYESVKQLNTFVCQNMCDNTVRSHTC